jgi:hypothetical protein
MRDLGVLGESTLTTWAAARGINAQRVTKDSSGWDYLLELPSRRASEFPALPRDREPAPISCVVQVKATSTNRLNRSVKLANWLQLINNPLPAFFLILDFGSADTPRAAYLVPLDARNSSPALKRIRELDSRSEDIAGHSLSLICREENRLEIPNGESLEKAILNHTGSSLEEYIQKKLEWGKTTGYESTTGSFNFKLTTENLHGASLLEYLVDLSLGLRSSLAIGPGEIRDVRFGIPAREPLREFPSGEIEIVREPGKQVEVTLRLGTSVVRTKMDMFLPRGLGKALTEDLLKILLKSRLFEFLICRSRMPMDFHIPDSETRVRLYDLYDLARVVLLLSESARLGAGVALNIRSDEGILMQRRLKPCVGIKPEIIELAAIIQDAWEVAKHLEIHETAELTIADLVSQKERFNLFRSLLAAEACELKVGFFDSPGLRFEGTRVCVPLGTEVMLGDYRGTVVVSVWGDVKCTGRKEEENLEYVVVTSERKVERTFATRRDEEPSLSLNAAANGVADAYNDFTCLILAPYTS